MTMSTSIQDPRNLAFEAIARREAHELQLQQKNNYNNKSKRSLEKCKVEGSSSLECTDHKVVNTPSKKGKYSFSGQTATRDADADHPLYLPLSHPVHEKLARPGVEVNVVDQILHELLQSGDSSQNYMQGSKRMKIDSRIRLDNYVQEHNMSSMAYAKALQSHSKRSRKHMSMKQHKKHGSLDMPQQLNFDSFKPMHEMWKGYITQLLESAGKNQLAQCLLTADLHGAHILVAECKMAAFKGVSGIMIRESAETFGIITKDNKFKVVLKKISVFMLQVDCWKITLHGDKLTSRKIGQ